MARTITLFYDVISPWSWFAYVLLKRYQSPWKFDLVLKPIYLGGVMVSAGNKPPVTVENKGKWMMGQDMPLVSKYFGIPYKYPDVFPVNTINIIRFLRIVEDKAPEKLDALTNIFYEQMWGLKGDAVKAAKQANFGTFIPDSLVPASTLKEWIESSQSDENKDRVKADAAATVGKGAFGFPYMTVTRDDGKNHNFFGSDRFELMSYFLGDKWEGPFPGGKRPSHL